MKPSKKFGGFHMNIGHKILQLRKQKGIKQEELAAELGVTAAAVSKWENGYTLPDILMLGALADFFGVTTDELLGRNAQIKYAVIATDLPELQGEIKNLVESYGFKIKQIYTDIKEARKAIETDSAIRHLFASFSRPLTEEEQGESPKGTRYIECHSDNKDGVLEGFEIYLQNKDRLDALAAQTDR